jgi:ATP-dependent Clp protease ATP-binding subunit ClpA
VTFTDDLKRTLAFAREETVRLQNAAVRPEHLALGICRSPSPIVRAALKSVDREALAADLERLAGPSVPTAMHARDLPYAQAAKQAIEAAMRAARIMNQRELESAHLLLGLLDLESASPSAVLRAHGVSASDIRRALLALPPEGAA